MAARLNDMCVLYRLHDEGSEETEGKCNDIHTLCAMTAEGGLRFLADLNQDVDRHLEAVENAEVASTKRSLAFDILDFLAHGRSDAGAEVFDEFTSPYVRVLLAGGVV